MDNLDSFEVLAREIFVLLEDGDSRIEYRTSMLRDTSVTWVRRFNPAGPSEVADERYFSLAAPYEVRESARRLRAACYREGGGTWFSARIVVTSAGEATADYNYDQEPEWDAPVDSVLYTNDQDRYPRDESAQPAWLKQKIAEGRAQIIAENNRARRR
ncbi:hypothetical protein [Mycetocola saprophilus]|uniref:hypothetical protein n=1 Tax=Mycetocola saprophilus TaxID=76636 RepID=UPI003BF3F280